MPFTLADLTLSNQSTRTPSDGTLIDEADDGAARVRIMYASTQYRFNIKTLPMTTAEAESLISYYTTNKANTVVFTWPTDSTTYTVRFLGRPVLTDSTAYGDFEASFELAGVES